MLRSVIVTVFLLFICWTVVFTWRDAVFFRGRVASETTDNAIRSEYTRGPPEHHDPQQETQPIDDARLDLRQSTARLPATWAKRDEVGQEICSFIFPTVSGRSGGSSPLHITSSVMWNVLKAKILDASYFPPSVASVPTFREWVQTLFKFYTTERLRRSVAQPPSNRAIRKLLQVAAKRWQYLVAIRSATSHTTTANSSSSDGMEPPEPIRIWVMGGSVTAGIGCYANVAGLRQDLWYGGRSTNCTWAIRLQHLLNHGLFHGQPVIEVTNHAIRATNTQVGAMLLDYQLIPELQEEVVPHIVISAYSTNDALDPNLNTTLHEHQQRFIRAAHNLRMCDDDFPIIVLADDLYGEASTPVPALHQTGSLYKIASWYNVMAIVYANVARHGAITHHVNSTQANPLFGSSASALHLGMGFHIGMAWTVLFNLLVAMHEVCSDTDVEEIGEVFVTSENHSLTAATDAAAVLTEFPTKFRGKFASTASEIREEWINNLHERDAYCNSRHNQPLPLVSLKNDSSSSSVLLPYSTNVCVYAWLISHPTNTYTPGHVTAALEPVMVRNHGWVAGEDVFLRPVALNATLSLQWNSISQETNYLTIVSMESYMPHFVGSKVNVTAQVLRAHGIRSDSNDTTIDPTATTIPVTTTDQYEISGHHNVRTSVHFPHKFRLPGNGARVGDSIRLQIQLVSGKSFKIGGMALCRF